MLDKDKVDTELARRFCAAFVSYQLGVSIALPIGDYSSGLIARAPKSAVARLVSGFERSPSQPTCMNPPSSAANLWGPSAHRNSRGSKWAFR